MLEKCELLQQAKDNYQNAILLFQNGKRDGFYRYLGYGEAFENVLRNTFELTDEENNQLVSLTDICDEYDEMETKFKWIEKAVKIVKNLVADRLDSKEFNTIVYRCGKIIRVDIKG